MPTLSQPSARRLQPGFWRRHGGNIQELAMLAPACILVIVFLLLPFLSSFRLALTNERLIPRPVPTKFVGLDNFQNVLADGDFWNAVWNVFRFTVMVLPVQCGLALALALLLNQKLPFRNAFRGVFFLPAITSIAVVCTVWGTLFQYPNGPLNQVVHLLSFGYAQPIDWLGDPRWAMLSIVLLSAWQAYGFQMVVYLAGLQNIPASLYEAAQLDGANAWNRFRHVTLPGLRQTNVFVLIITTIQAFKLFVQVNILTQGGPRGTTDTVVQYMFTAGFVNQRLGYGAAVSILLFVIVLIISLLQRYVTRG
ncbi:MULTISPECIES: sugar ABC transporter permease [unclassified Rhizobium]|jgi:multiple sugar transport system permease protein|uniref:carbohydrate ABC transporter permease n=1 Tax=unclassified Rhizobium TaxID=2613769 RepID=UPI000648CFC8|nr:MULTISPECIES: sugar ABC transporter permease [unclassified Rhizobium]OJY73028.1 MAG: ABC transporter permease [Rhizobium sp. 60-20]